MALTYKLFPAPVPDFAAAELERLYQSIYCTLLRLETYEQSSDWLTFAILDDEVVVAVILFKRRGRTISMLNEQITLDAAYVKFFVDSIFELYSDAGRVALYAVDTAGEKIGRLFGRFLCVKENVVSLGQTDEEFAATLTASVRSGLRSRHRKLQKDFPNFSYDFYNCENFSEDDVEAIVRLSAKRMNVKGKDAYIDGDALEKIIVVLRKYGLVGVARIDGEVCGGTLCYAVGRRYFFHVISHHPNYDRFGLGNLLNYLTFLYCVEMKIDECWMMGGGERHKAQFGARPLEFFGFDFYRSRRYFPFLIYDRAVRVSNFMAKKILQRFGIGARFLHG